MGFDLACVFTLRPEIFALYDRVIPGGSGHALRTSGRGLPDGWVLPMPWELEAGTDGGLTMAPDALTPPDPAAWRSAAGIPAAPDPLHAFVQDDYVLGSQLSLAAPVMLVHDSTFGGVLGHEYAALFVHGRLVAAQGVDFQKSSAFELDDRAYRTASLGKLSPTTRCAALLDPRFAGRFLYEGYLPRSPHREGAPCRDVWSGPVPAIDPAWKAHFPALLGR